MTTWLTAQEAADYVKCSERTIRDTVKAGDIPAYTFGTGRQFRIKASDVDAWLEARSWEPSAS